MVWPRRTTSPRRAEIRKKVPDQRSQFWLALRGDGRLVSLGVAAAFFVITTAILMFRVDVLPYRPGQYVTQDILARVEFSYRDKEQLNRIRQDARESVLRIYAPQPEVWDAFEGKLLELPDRVAAKTLEETPASLRELFRLDSPALRTQLDSAALTALDQAREGPRREGYRDAVRAYVDSLRGLVLLSAKDRRDEVRRQEDIFRAIPRIEVAGVGPVELSRTYALSDNANLISELQVAARKAFGEELQSKIVAFTVNAMQSSPTHVLDEAATTERQNTAAASVPATRGDVVYKANQVLKSAADKGDRRPIDDRDWQLLKAEHEAYLASLDAGNWVKSRVGVAGVVLVLTIALGAYVQSYQPRVVRNHARAVAIAALLIAMLLLAQLAGIGTGSLYLFGVTPTILVAMILAIAYDRRFAMGVASLHGMLVTVALDQGIGFYLVLFFGVLTCGFLLNEVRTRAKLVEVGGATALAMMLATAATGAMSLDPVHPLAFILRNCLYVGASGLLAGFVTLGSWT